MAVGGELAAEVAPEVGAVGDGAQGDGATLERAGIVGLLVERLHRAAADAALPDGAPTRALLDGEEVVVPGVAHVVDEGGAAGEAREVELGLHLDALDRLAGGEEDRAARAEYDAAVPRFSGSRFGSKVGPLAFEETEAAGERARRGFPAPRAFARRLEHGGVHRSHLLRRHACVVAAGVIRLGLGEGVCFGRLDGADAHAEVVDEPRAVFSRLEDEHESGRAEEDEWEVDGEPSVLLPEGRGEPHEPVDAEGPHRPQRPVGVLPDGSDRRRREIEAVGGCAAREEGDDGGDGPERVEPHGRVANARKAPPHDERRGIDEDGGEEERDREVDDEGVDVRGPLGDEVHRRGVGSLER